MALNDFLPARQLLFHFDCAGGASELPLRQGFAQIKNIRCVRAEMFVHSLQFSEADLVDRFALSLRQGDDLDRKSVV